MLDESKISQEAAEALYMGIVHDTACFAFLHVSGDFGGGSEADAQGCPLQ